ncbi:hypothetical protein DV738_g1892, partial [Chaetothyriales sp. CBS 135597]
MLSQLSRPLALAAAAYAALAFGQDLEALFSPYLSSGAEIAESTEANFSTVVGPRWSSWEVPNWSGAIKPATVNDIQEIVRIASANDIPFLATNGGHGTKANLSQFTGIDVNLANFNSVSVDTNNNLLTVGPGVVLGQISTTLLPLGKELRAIGVTLGGGIGILKGRHGLIIDDLVSVKIVVASGDEVTASKTENPDLFWAVRGAGANFGIVTEATYNVHDLTNDGYVVEANFAYAAAQNRSFWELLQKYEGSQLPAELSIQAAISYNRTRDEPVIGATLWYLGSESDIQSILDEFTALEPTSSSIQTLTQVEVYYESVTRGVCNRGGLISAYTLGLGQIDPASFEAHFEDLVTFYQANTNYYGLSFFQIYSNEATSQTPVWETAFPWRDVQTWWLLQNVYVDDSQETTIEEFSREQRTNLQATSGFDTPHVYLGYAHGDEGPAAWFSEDHLQALRALKALWDPTNIFGVGADLF